jgi:hypothetical protein
MKSIIFTVLVTICVSALAKSESYQIATETVSSVWSSHIRLNDALQQGGFYAALESTKAKRYDFCEGITPEDQDDRIMAVLRGALELRNNVKVLSVKADDQNCIVDIQLL